MKAISLWQPWATLCAIGAKQVETRGRDCTYRGPLAIHAAKRWERDQYSLCLQEPFLSMLKAAGYVTYHNGIPIVELPLGKIVAMSNLNDSKHMGSDDRPAEWIERVSGFELAFGNYAPNRFGLFLQDTKKLVRPVSCRGMQAIPFEVPPDVARLVEQQLGAAA